MEYLLKENREDYLNVLNESEEILYNLSNRLITKTNNKSDIQAVTIHYLMPLLTIMTSTTKNLDSYVNIEFYIERIKKVFKENVLKEDEKNLFENFVLKFFGEIFVKTDKFILSKQNEMFVLEFLFNGLLENFEEIIKEENMIKTVLKIANENKFEQKKFNKFEIGKFKFEELFQFFDCFFKFYEKFTNDINTGKKIIKNVYDIIAKKIQNPDKTLKFFEIVLTFIFSKCESIYSEKEQELFTSSNNNNLVNPNNNIEKPKILIVSIFQYICDSFNDKVFDFNITNNVNENANINMFNELMFNFPEILLRDQILNERFMEHFSVFFIEDCYSEVLGTKNNNKEEKLLLRLFEIITKHPQSLKLSLAFIINTSRHFSVHKESNNNITHYEKNKMFLEKIYIKLTFLLNNLNLINKSYKETIESNEILQIIWNFSSSDVYLRTYFTNFFISFFLFVDRHYSFRFEFKNRKNLYVILMEIFYEKIILFNENRNEEENKIQIPKLFELLFVMMKNYSFPNLEDAGIVFKILNVTIKKLNENLIQFSRFQYKFVIFFHIFMINLISLIFNSTTLVSNLTNIREGFISSIKNKEIYLEIENLIEIQNFSKTIQNFLNLIENEKTFSNILDFPQKHDFNDIIEKILKFYYSNYSTLNEYFQRILNEKGLSNLYIEVNNEMTFRNFNNVTFTDNMSEHSMVLSNRDIVLNDSFAVILNTEERKSDAFRIEIPERGGRVVDIVQMEEALENQNNQRGVFNEMNEFIKTKALNNIKK